MRKQQHSRQYLNWLTIRQEGVYEVSLLFMGRLFSIHFGKRKTAVVDLVMGPISHHQMLPENFSTYPPKKVVMLLN